MGSGVRKRRRSFKAELFDICASVAKDFDGWAFSPLDDNSGEFRNPTLGHTDLVVFPGCSFRYSDNTVLNPMAGISNTKVNRLYERLLGSKPYVTLLINLRLESSDYYGPSAVSGIWERVIPFNDQHGTPQPWPATWIVLDQAEDYFRKLLTDGIRFIHAYFDLTTEEQLLQHLPTTYKWMDKGIGNSGKPGSFHERGDGVMHCLAAIVRGDFDFVERYATPAFETMYPKDQAALQRIMEALPGLKGNISHNGPGLPG